MYLNDGKLYELAAYERGGDALPKLFPDAKDGDTIRCRNRAGITHYKFIKDRWYDVGFSYGPER